MPGSRRWWWAVRAQSRWAAAARAMTRRRAARAAGALRARPAAAGARAVPPRTLARVARVFPQPAEAPGLLRALAVRRTPGTTAEPLATTIAALAPEPRATRRVRRRATR